MSVARAIVISMRPRQWTKNLIVFVPLLFARKFDEPAAIAASLATFGVFCLASSVIYILNDLWDMKRDRLHEMKCLRPLASGALSPRIAWVTVVAGGSLALLAAFGIAVPVGLATLAFVVLNICYTFWLKRMVILDVMSISAGLVLRAVAGAAAVDAAASPWLYVCAALLALFLGFGKRRHELLLLGSSAGSHREVLDEYSPQLLDVLLATVTAATIIAYSLYAFFSPTAKEADHFMFTVPFVVYGVFRYLYLMYKRNLGGSPEEILLTDVPLIVTTLGWLVLSTALLWIA